MGGHAAGGRRHPNLNKSALCSEAGPELKGLLAHNWVGPFSPPADLLQQSGLEILTHNDVSEAQLLLPPVAAPPPQRHDGTRRTPTHEEASGVPASTASGDNNTCRQTRRTPTHEEASPRRPHLATITLAATAPIFTPGNTSALCCAVTMLTTQCSGVQPAPTSGGSGVPPSNPSGDNNT